MIITASSVLDPPIGPIDSLRYAITTDPRDWSDNATDAWIYGLVVGWGVALPEIAVKFHWSRETADLMKAHRKQMAALEQQSNRKKAAKHG